MEYEELERISNVLHARAGHRYDFAHPMELVRAANMIAIPYGNWEPAYHRLGFEWSADSREVGLSIAHALAKKFLKRESSDVAVLLAGYFLAPIETVRTYGYDLTLAMQPNAPGWFLRTWLRHNRARYSPSGSLRFRNLRIPG